MTVTTRDLGLAAFMQMKGAALVSVAPGAGGWTFNSDRLENDWRVEYYNSESFKHDQAVIALKRFVAR